MDSDRTQFTSLFIIIAGKFVFLTSLVQDRQRNRDRNKDWVVKANINLVSASESDFKYAGGLRLHR